MVLFKINHLYDEIQRVYNEHYKDCKHQEVHDFYRAVMKRMRTTYQNDYVIVPVVQCKDCKHFNTDIHSFPCRMGLRFASEDGFCNHGERRTGNEIWLD